MPEEDRSQLFDNWASTYDSSAISGVVFTVEAQRPRKPPD
jgi:hypothetical protein